MPVSLHPLSGGPAIRITLPITLVGSSEGCDFLIKGAADLCCVLVLADGLLLVRDLETGSIRVNGQRLRRAVLQENDRLSIANRDFEVHYQADSR